MTEKRRPPDYTARAEGSRARDKPPQIQPGPEIEAPTPQVPEAASFQSTFASLSLHRTDRLRLLAFPPETIVLVRQAIQQGWKQGIQQEEVVFGSHEFKLRGNPWLGLGEEAMLARRLVRTIFEVLFDAGWVLALSTDVSKKTKDKDTLIFRQQIPPPRPRDWIWVSFSKKDRLRVMGAPKAMLDAIRVGIGNFIQSLEDPPLSGVWEVKLKGYPWAAHSGDDVMNARRLLLRLFALLEKYGYTVYASIDQKADMDSDKGETDTWYCCRPKDWEEGAPVYHA